MRFYEPKLGHTFPENASKHLDVFEAHLDCCSCSPLRGSPFHKWSVWQCWIQYEITKWCHHVSSTGKKNLSFAHKIWTNIISFSCVLRFISRLRCGVQHWRSRYSRCANPAANNTKSKSVEDAETGIQTQLFRLSDEWFSRAGPGCGLISRVAKTRNI